MLTKAGTNAADFVVIPGAADACAAGTTLSPGQACTFTFRFTPGALGDWTANLKVAASPGGSTARVDLSGTGIAATALAITPTPYDFGAVTAGLTSTSVTFVLTNHGATPATGLAIGLTGEFAKADAGSTCGVMLAEGSTCAYVVNFRPVGAAGARAGAVTVMSSNGTATAALSGRARQDATLVAVPAGAHSFGDVIAGQSGEDYALTIRNDGEVPSGPLTATLSGTSKAAFSVVAGSNTCTTLAPGKTCSLKLRYSPPATGAIHTATVSITASPGGSVAIALTGSSVSTAAISLSLSSLSFGDQAVGTESPAAVLMASNLSGTATSGPLTFTLGRANKDDFRIDTTGCPAPLPGGAKCPVRVYFRPRAASAGQTADLVVAATPGGSSTTTLNGNGIHALSANTGAGTFASALVGTSGSEVAFTVTNALGAPTSGLLHTVVGGTDASQFVVTSDGCAGAALAGGASCVVKVRFVPTVAGSLSASLKVSGSPGGVATAALTALANAPP